jgi:hypothetical protein
MTTPKNLETISGSVEQVNAKGTGIKVLGEWLKVSQFHPIANMPTAGELVEVQVETTDRGQWINSLKILGASPAPVLPTPRDAEIRRQVAIKTAAQLVGAFAQTRRCASSMCSRSPTRSSPGSSKKEVMPLRDALTCTRCFALCRTLASSAREPPPWTAQLVLVTCI